MEKRNNEIQEELENARQLERKIGIWNGIEEGEFRERMNIAYRMILAGESDEKIKQYTNTTKEEVEEYMD